MKREPDCTMIDIPFRFVKPLDKTLASGRESYDLMNIDFVLCNEGVNDRGDRFNARELQAAYKTAINKLINWEHKEPNIGTIADSSLTKNEENRYSVECHGKIWKYVYPDYAEAIKDALSQGDPEYGREPGFVSMEAWFPSFNMILSPRDNVHEYLEVFTFGSSEANELQELRGTYLKEGYLVSRELVDLFFGGAGITVIPADGAAIIKSAASAYANVEEYHKHLHEVAEGHRFSPLTEEQIIKEHDRMHRENPGLFSVVSYF